jgi:CrcB protein
MGYLIVFLGAGLGGACRHGVNLLALRLFGAAFPWATLAVNVAGSLLMGVLAGWGARGGGLPQELRLFLATGLLGGFTTFSAFSLEVALLWEQGDAGMAALLGGASVGLSVAGLVLGLTLVRAVAALTGAGG